MAERILPAPPTTGDDPTLALWAQAITSSVNDTPVYGGLLTTGSPEISGLGASAVTLGAFNLQMPSQDVSVSTLLNTLTIEVPGPYTIFQQSSFTGVAQNEYQTHLHLNGSETSLGWHRKIGAANDAGSASCSGILNLIESDTLAFKAEITDGAGDIISLEEAQFYVQKIR
jgi:hypothetical protein